MGAWPAACADAMGVQRLSGCGGRTRASPAASSTQATQTNPKVAV